MKNIETIDRATTAALNEKGLFNIRTTDGGISGVTAANNVLPAGILTNISPDMVRVITRKRTADMVVGDRKKLLNWEQNDALIPLLEQLGETQPYSDYESAPTTAINPDFIYAGHYRFSSKVQVGDLESRQLALARVSAQAEKTAAALETLAIEFNNIAFFGLPSQPDGAKYPVYGILNNPSLPAYKAATSTTAAATFDTVYADIQSMITDVLVSARGHADPSSRMYLAIANSRAAWLGLVNQYGKSVKEVVKENYPNLEWILSPEFVGAYTGDLDVMYLRVESDGLANVKDSAVLGFSELALSSATEVYANHTEQVVSSGSVGAIVYRPYMFARRYFTA